ncbi:cytochrome c oxidase subunit 3 family protein [Motiliproteus sp. MSK22-1]|uniref:cytochrome c oxidase subunit 3 family protein n=1 Tax=Motiliproteus sp. MSK22-1 TaxID=1897630 RepID=UPI0009766C0B|nr:cytochrome c oxidase subunit 3 family protein [Motiliproteus sp. MSK22-1]OMH25852.1 cytochrome C oxidase subunit III [Motiliproteus sp. MSK22-1]
MSTSLSPSLAPTLDNQTAERLPRDNRIPGNGAVWVGIFAELSEFALMFLVYFIAKVHYLELFREGPVALNTTAGVLNTLALLTSSYFVAKAMSCVRMGRIKTAINWLWGTIGAAIFYLLVKGWEYFWNNAQGIEVDTNVFFTLYYYMTFNHFLHVAWGGGAILWAIFRLKTGGYTAEDHEGMEAIACYWHMIDLVWIIIFPLLYVLR